MAARRRVDAGSCRRAAAAGARPACSRGRRAARALDYLAEADDGGASAATWEEAFRHGATGCGRTSRAPQALAEMRRSPAESGCRQPGTRHDLLFLFEAYEPRCYYFEAVECLRRLAPTGLPVFKADDDADEVALSVCCR